jgi:hypothetical protein
MRPAFAAALRNPVSAIGVALTSASALLFLALVALLLAGFLQNPYVGIIVFLMVPGVFVLGLLLIPVGLWLDRRRARAGAAAPEWPTLDLGNASVRRTLLFVAVATLLNLAIISTASFGAVEYLESQAFCGQACHSVMEPEFVAHHNGPHASVHCVRCHVASGAGGFLAAKLNGTRQLAAVATGTYHRPIPTPIQDIPGVQWSCEQCHWPDRFVGDVVKIFYEHADDEANTQTKTTLRLHVGGPITGTGSGTGIHWHMNRGNVVEYVALDDEREQIPYVRMMTPDGAVREYFAEGVTPEDLEGKPRRRMDCLDCHTRPAHTFGASPEREIDAALGEGLINAKIPFVRREAVRALQAPYPSHEVALPQIEQALRAGLNAGGSNGVDGEDVRRAIGVTQAIYRRNVFPSMNIGWGTYPTQIGHTTSTGCFRCHDESHKTRDGLVIRQDCEMCHTIE